VTDLPFARSDDVKRPATGDVLKLGAALLAAGLCYFALARLGLMLALINPSATPIWPATGFAVAMVLLWGYRLLPAIFAGAFAANLITAGSVLSSAVIALGNSLEAFIIVWMVNRWSDGRETFARPFAVAKFASIALTPGTMVSATIGVGVLVATGFASVSNYSAIWMTWWLGDVTGALLFTPFVVLWVNEGRRFLEGGPLQSLAIYLAAAAVGIVAFSPLFEDLPYRGPLAFLALVPLVWAALRGHQRDTATASLILAAFAIWGVRSGTGPFAGPDLNFSFLMFLMFLISVSVPSLALSADAAIRHRTEEDLREAQTVLNETIAQRDAAFNQLERALESEIAHRQQLELQTSRTEVALADTERNFRLLVESLTDYALIMLDTNGRVTSWNPGAERIKGYKAEEIIGKHFGTFQNDADRSTGLPEKLLTTAAREGKFEGEGWRVRKDGSQFWASIVIYSIRDDHGELIGFAKVTRDISERREAQAAIERARQQMATTQKMEAIGQLTGGVAHDFNNLLMIVSGHVEILHRRLADPKITQAIEAIQTASRHGERLTRQLLSFSRQQSLDPDVIDLRSRIEIIRPMMASSLRENIRFVDAIAPDVWRIEIDTAEFELALLNVAVNARDAMPNGGIFSMTAINTARAPDTPTGPLRGQFVAIALKDTGNGIPADLIGKVFDPFFTTKAVGKGTGLGLSQVYGFAHQSGGTVTVESKSGLGTTVTIYLPRTDKALPESERKPQAEASAAKPPRRSGRILVVEDNSSVAQVTQSLLEQIGYETIRTDSATEALKLLDSGQTFDLVFSDIVMPGTINGIGLAERIKERHRGIPVLLTTGYSEGLKLAGSNFDVLRKPFVVDTLEQAVQSAIAAKKGKDKLGAATAKKPSGAATH
jgi:PAS domain S-box-containing protein